MPGVQLSGLRHDAGADWLLPHFRSQLPANADNQPSCTFIDFNSSADTSNKLAYLASLESDSFSKTSYFKCFFTCHFQKPVYAATMGISMTRSSMKKRIGLASLFSTFCLDISMRSCTSFQATSNAEVFISQPLLSVVVYFPVSSTA